jgi:uncharacterized protein
MQALRLEPHLAEGGYYRELYQSDRWHLADGRIAIDTIYYMLTDDSPIGHLHKNRSDIVHFYHCGGALRYTTIDPLGTVSSFVLGANPEVGEELQHVVRGGWWKSSELISGQFGLISEAVVPAFAADDRTIATRSSLIALFPDLDEELLRLAWG